jgi:hypothetical protein
MKPESAYKFSGLPWEYTGKGAWIFVSLPQKMSTKIRKLYSGDEEGWGRLRTTATIGNTEWKTAIWFDSKRKTYLLPLKTEIRKKESITFNTRVTVTITF